MIYHTMYYLVTYFVLYPSWGSNGNRLTLTPRDQLQIRPSAFGQGHWRMNLLHVLMAGKPMQALEEHANAAQKGPASAGFEPRTFLLWANRIANRNAGLPTGAPEFQWSSGHSVYQAVLCRLTYFKFCWGLYTTVSAIITWHQNKCE